MHSIRLRGPWQYEIHPNTDGSVPSRSGQIKLPGDWAQPISDIRANSNDEPVRIELTRSFNAPTGIESSKVKIQLSNLGSPAKLDSSLTINGQRVAAQMDNESQLFDITPHLAQHNQLAIQVTLNPTRNYLGEVTIQIHDL